MPETEGKPLTQTEIAVFSSQLRNLQLQNYVSQLCGHVSPQMRKDLNWGMNNHAYTDEEWDQAELDYEENKNG